MPKIVVAKAISQVHNRRVRLGELTSRWEWNRLFLMNTGYPSQTNFTVVRSDDVNLNAGLGPCLPDKWRYQPHGFGSRRASDT